jgi:hypothetical protein
VSVGTRWRLSDVPRTFRGLGLAEFGDHHLSIDAASSAFQKPTTLTCQKSNPARPMAGPDSVLLVGGFGYLFCPGGAKPVGLVAGS